MIIKALKYDLFEDDNFMTEISATTNRNHI